MTATHDEPLSVAEAVHEARNSCAALVRAIVARTSQRRSDATITRVVVQRGDDGGGDDHQERAPDGARPDRTIGHAG